MATATVVRAVKNANGTEVMVTCPCRGCQNGCRGDGVVHFDAKSKKATDCITGGTHPQEYRFDVPINLKKLPCQQEGVATIPIGEGTKIVWPSNARPNLPRF